MPAPVPPPYRVEYLPTAKRGLLQLYLTAKRSSRLADLIAVAENVEHRLRSEPLVFGEPIYDLHHARIQIRVGVQGPLVLEYGVSLDQPLVFVREVRSSQPIQ